MREPAHARPMRGSTAVHSRSTTRLVTITTITSTSTTPWMTGKSLLIVDTTIRLPRPGMANTTSITTVAPSSRLNSKPVKVNSVTATLRSPWRQMIAVGDRPLACSVRTNCDDSTSTSAPRNWREISATEVAASATAGNAACQSAPLTLSLSDTAPVAGNQCNDNAKVETRIMPSQNPGNATPMEAIVVTATSTQP